MSAFFQILNWSISTCLTEIVRGIGSVLLGRVTVAKNARVQNYGSRAVVANIATTESLRVIAAYATCEIYRLKHFSYMGKMVDLNFGAQRKALILESGRLLKHFGLIVGAPLVETASVEAVIRSSVVKRIEMGGLV